MLFRAVFLQFRLRRCPMGRQIRSGAGRKLQHHAGLRNYVKSDADSVAGKRLFRHQFQQPDCLSDVVQRKFEPADYLDGVRESMQFAGQRSKRACQLFVSAGNSVLAGSDPEPLEHVADGDLQLGPGSARVRRVVSPSGLGFILASMRSGRTPGSPTESAPVHEGPTYRTSSWLLNEERVPVLIEDFTKILLRPLCLVRYIKLP